MATRRRKFVVINQCLTPYIIIIGYEKDAPSIKVLTILTLPLLLEEVELSLLDNMEEASSEKAESELVSWPSVPPPLGIERCFRNLISSASELCT